MNLLLTGLNHRTSPLELRERVAFDQNSLPAALGRLAVVAPELQEFLILSTCNRTEVLVRTTEMSAAHAHVQEFLMERSHVEADTLAGMLYTHRDMDAVRHLFRVAGSLDSMVIGEPQILHQVHVAHTCAARESRIGALLDSLCRRAFHAAKRIRSETRIGENPVSIAYAACELAKSIFGALGGRSVLVIGAGKMSELAVRHLLGAGAASVQVTTRNHHRAVTLARKVGGEAVAYDRKDEYLEKVDIVVSSTAAPHPILSRADVAELIKRRRNRPIFFIDIAVPRDIDPAANEIDNVYLYDIDDLQRVVDSGFKDRYREAEKAEKIVDAEVEAFQRWYLSLAAGPTISELRETLHALRESELQRFASRFRELEPGQATAVEEFSKALINKILHRPIQELKRSLDGRSTPGQAEAVRRLFGLDGQNESVAAGRSRGTARQQDVAVGAIGSQPSRSQQGEEKAPAKVAGSEPGKPSGDA